MLDREDGIGKAFEGKADVVVGLAVDALGEAVGDGQDRLHTRARMALRLYIASYKPGHLSSDTQ